MAQAQSVQLPKRLPLLIGPENRASSTDKDSRLVNCYVEKDPDGEYQIYRRPGLLKYFQPPGAAATGRGLFVWQDQLYSIFGNTLYRILSAVAGTVSTGNGDYRFDSCLGTTPRLIFGDGLVAYTYTIAGGIVQITDPQFPGSFKKGWAYLNGTNYVAVSGSANIQGSDINDPINWNALNVIQAQIEPDTLISLAKQLVYIIAFKQWSVEVFYDAANPTGSPLGRVEGAKIDYGCATYGFIQSINDALLWMTSNRSSLRQIALMQGLKAHIVSTPAIERLISAWVISTAYSWQVMLNGHIWYVITSKDSNMTLAYDLSTNMWSQWTDANGNYLPIVSSACLRSSNGASVTLLQHESDGYLYTIDSAQKTDDTSLIPVDIYCPNFDGGTRRGKQLNMMYFNGDRVTGSTLQVRYNDFDYDSTKWSNFRYVDLGQETPMLEQEGTFTRRAYNFRHKAATEFRLSSVDLQMDLCVL